MPPIPVSRAPASTGVPGLLFGLSAIQQGVCQRRAPLIRQGFPVPWPATIWTRFEQVRNDWAAASGIVPESAHIRGLA